MYGGELTHQILKYLRQGHTHVHIASLVHKHPNTITNHVKWLRAHQLYGDEETLNKIDDRLIEELNTMALTQLLTWRGQLVPKRIESTSELTVKKEVHSIDVRQWTTDERDEITRVARRIAAARTLGNESS
jgi:hypothetical protein